MNEDSSGSAFPDQKKTSSEHNVRKPLRKALCKLETFLLKPLILLMEQQFDLN